MFPRVPATHFNSKVESPTGRSSSLEWRTFGLEIQRPNHSNITPMKFPKYFLVYERSVGLQLQNQKFHHLSSVMRQKRANLETNLTRKQSTQNFPKNEHFLPPDMHTYVCVSGGEKCSIFGKFGMLCFLVTSVLRFALLPYYGKS